MCLPPIHNGQRQGHNFVDVYWTYAYKYLLDIQLYKMARVLESFQTETRIVRIYIFSLRICQFKVHQYIFDLMTNNLYFRVLT